MDRQRMLVLAESAVDPLGELRQALKTVRAYAAGWDALFKYPENEQEMFAASPAGMAEIGHIEKSLKGALQAVEKVKTALRKG